MKNENTPTNDEVQEQERFEREIDTLFDVELKEKFDKTYREMFG